MKIISREEAKCLELKRYFTNIPCKHGHISERLVSDCGCLECSKQIKLTRLYNKTRQWIEENGPLPTCATPSCNNRVNMRWRGSVAILNEFCSRDCANSNKTLLQHRREQTMIDRHGVVNISHKQETTEKRKATCLNKFGVEYSVVADECLNKKQR